MGAGGAMKRKLFSLIAAGLAGLFGEVAEATVSLTVTASGDFTPGSVITLDTYVTADAGETDNTVFGAWLYPASQVNSALDPGPAGSQQQFSLPGAGWVLGSLSCTTARCLAFNQINAIAPTAINASNFLIATNTFTIELDELPGSVITFSWQSTPTTKELDFFGVVDTPGFVPGISITVVPEPSTAALIAFGLCGLVAASRRRA
jgi:hypothetical protein